MTAPFATWLLANAYFWGPALLAVSLWLARRAVRAKAELEARVDARTVLDERAPDEGAAEVVLDGVLRCEAPVALPDEGEGAAFTVAPSARRFAFVPAKVPIQASRGGASLALEVGEERYPIVGPVSVRVGSRHWWPGDKLRSLPDEVIARMGPDGATVTTGAAGAQRGVVRSLSDGDRVRVVGRWATVQPDDDDHRGDYRQRAAKREIHAAADDGVELVALEAPRFVASTRAMMLSPAVVVAVLMAIVLPVGLMGLHQQARIDCLAPCVTRGACTVGVTPAYELICYATSAERCRQSFDCQENGLCSFSNGACIALSDDDCWPTAECRHAGLCSAVRGVCVAAKKQDCNEKVRCIREGRCTPSGGVCAVVSDADCAATEVCRSQHRCVARDGECRVSRAKACRDSDGCAREGRCRSDGEGCVVGKDRDCRAAELCASRGLCGMVVDDDGEARCVAVSEDDCRASKQCLDHGLCLLDGHRCGADAGTCRTSRGCLQAGACTYEAGVCVSPDWAPCRSTTGCLERGYCSMLPGGSCAAKTDADCQRSDACRDSGQCTVVDGQCEAKTDLDCQAATVCRMNGRCRAQNGMCL